MRLSKPRIPPVALDQLTPGQAAVLAGRRGFAGQADPLNVLRTMARAFRTLERYLGWSDYIVGPHSDLDPRLRELVILRTGWFCLSGYEWSQHAAVGRDVGLSKETILRVKLDAEAFGWSAPSSSNGQPGRRRRRMGDKGRMDLIFTCGEYVMVVMLLNSLGVQIEAGQPVDCDLQGSDPAATDGPCGRPSAVGWLGREGMAPFAVDIMIDGLPDLLARRR